MTEKGTIETTEIMKFMVLPIELLAKAWLDPAFCDALLKYPRSFLLERSDKYSRFAQYILMRDTPVIKHFILPHLSGARMPDNLDAKLREETGAEEDYTEFLLAAVLCQGRCNYEPVENWFPLIKNALRIRCQKRRLANAS